MEALGNLTSILQYIKTILERKEVTARTGYGSGYEGPEGDCDQGNETSCSLKSRNLTV
jgi:hypothetical protein